MNTKANFIMILLLTTVFYASLVYSKPVVRIVDNDPCFKISPRQYRPDVVIIQQVKLDPNRIRTYFYNKGIFNQDLSLSNTPGFEWPKDSNTFACFTAGLCIAAKINGQLRQAMASYSGEYAQGYIDGIGGPVMTDSRFRIYWIKSTDNAGTNPDCSKWIDMIPFGAPYVDVNNNGQYDPGIDKPGIKNAEQTLFACLTDGFPEEHSVGEGFGGGTLPVMAQVQLTAWGYDKPGLEDVQFIKWVIINKNSSAWDSLHMSTVVDPDLGWADDDYIGCDTSLNLGYCYNGDDDDNINQSIYAYGPHPPAFGMDYFRSPVNYNINPPDTLGMTSFVYFTCTGGGGPPCENDPNGEPVGAYNMLQGLKKDRTPWYNPLTGFRTKFVYPGDPESGVGWTEHDGRVLNCNGDSITPNNVTTQNSPCDSRFIMNTGADNFRMNPGDTQTIVLAQLMARGSSNLNSVTKLKELDRRVQYMFDKDFNVIPEPESPLVNISYKDKGNGKTDIVLSWDNRSEGYLYWDTIFNNREDSCFYKFEGYEIYEIKRSATSIPDFNNPKTITSDVTLLKIYDLVDTVGIIYDTLSTGLTMGVFSVVPPYPYTIPPDFPNTGITRSIELYSTKYKKENGGDSNFIYGREYKFAVLAYAYNINPKRHGQAVFRNSLVTSVFTVIPEAPLAGTKYTLQTSDTINTNKRDLPIVLTQELLIDAKYKVLFGNPDTTYNLLRSTNDGVTYDTLHRNLDVVVSTSDDSSKIIDGILIKAQRIKQYNAGVIKDLTLPRDSIQTRYNGWDYIPENNRYLTASETLFVQTKPYQSESMNLSWPEPNTFTGNGTSVPAHRLRKIKIVYTGYGNGQMAYRFLRNVAPFPGQDPVDPSFVTWVINRNIGFPYQQLNEVPFKVYEIDQDDGTTGYRQINCAFLENNDSLYNSNGVFLGKGRINGKWDPTTHSSGGFEVLYIFESGYDTNLSNYKTDNLYMFQSVFDIMYVWAPMADTSGPDDFTTGDEFTIYPYTVTVPFIAPGFPLIYEFETPKAIIGSTSLAVSRGDMDRIRVVPNPYYGYNHNQSSITDGFVTFRRLPEKCTIKIYSLNGDMIRQLDKDNTDATLRWNMRNLESVPIASGMYIALIDAVGIGQKIIKLAIFTPRD
jgi:hypothetical protein